MPRLSLSLVLGLFLFLAACDSNPMDPGPSTPASLTGIWVGEVNSGGTLYLIEMTLTDDRTVITGMGTARSPQDTLDFSIQGDYVHPLVSLALIYDRPPPGTLAGNINEARDLIRGTISGPGYAGVVDMMLRRQQAPIPAL